MDDIKDLFKLDISIPEESFEEMATVVLDRSSNLRIQVNPDRGRKGVPYFKVFDSMKLKPNETRVCRLHFLDTGIEIHNDPYKEWIPSNKEIKVIKKVLNEQSTDDKNYTNWQMACWLWVKEYSIFNNDKIAFSKEDYFNGLYDNDEDFYSHPSYVPSITPIPETWEE